MPPAASRPLTERQRAVIERIDRRVPIKVIAQELGVSETRINQHIRALKDIFDATSLGELVENYRDTIAANDSADPAIFPWEPPPHATLPKGLSKIAYSKKQITYPDGFADQVREDDLGELVLSDVVPVATEAPWLRHCEPKVVPGVLDGEHAVLLRLAAIVGIAFGFLAAVVLTVTAGLALSEALTGHAAIPVDESGYS